MHHFLRYFIPVIVGLAIYSFPTPEGLDPRGWKLLAIFVSTIVAVITKPLPTGAVALTSLLLCVLTGTLDLGKEGLSGYGSSIIWLIVYVFFIAKGFIKSNLGTRIAYFFVSILGKHSLGLGYGMTLTTLLVSPVVPSSTARAGGILYPIAKAISDSLDSHAHDGTSRRVGAFLMKICFHANLITGAMFLTGMAGNPLAQKIAEKQGVEITWLNWALAACVPGMISLAVIPLLIYIIFPPELKALPGVVGLAKKKLDEMGPMSHNEIIMSVTAFIMLGLWVFGSTIGISATATALVGLCILLLTGVLEWGDVLAEHNAWNTLIWFAILVGMAGYLDEFGVVGWFSNKISVQVVDLPWAWAFILLNLIYFYSHYFFASMTAHVGAMYGAFLAVAMLAGTPPLLAALGLAFTSNLFACTTHYGATAGVVLYGAGYVRTKDWWLVGFIVSLVLIAIWVGIGGMWWKYLNLW